VHGSRRCHVADVHNNTACEVINYRTPTEVRDGYTPDISGLIQHHFWDQVYYKDFEHGFPAEGGNEKKGRWMGRALDYGDKMCYYILTDDTEQLIVRSMVRSATETDRPNRAFPPEPEDLNRKHTGESFPIISKPINVAEFPRAPNIQRKGHAAEIDPDEIINMYVYDTYKNKSGNTVDIKGTVRERFNDGTYRVEYPDGKQRIYEYEDLIDKLNRQDEDDEERWTFDKILSHRWSPLPERRGKIDLQLKWDGYEVPTWEPLEVMKRDDPVTVAKYAQENGLVEQSMWKWAKRYIKNEKKITRMYRQMLAAKSRKTGAKYQFGVRVPRSLKQAYELDRLNGDTGWGDVIKKEVNTLYETYECFKVLEENEEVPREYRQIPL